MTRADREERMPEHNESVVRPMDEELMDAGRLDMSETGRSSVHGAQKTTLERLRQLGYLQIPALMEPDRKAHQGEVRSMTVELLYTEGCPHAAAYLPHLQQLVGAAGLGEPVRARLVADDEQARQERFLGSPTIRVAGVDVDPTARRRLDYGLTCRLYAAPEGLRGHPSDETRTSR